MDLEQLNRIYKQNSWLIAKASGKAGFKAATLGSETLEALIVAMADNYGLDENDRALLFPIVAIDVHQSVVGAADYLVKAPQALEIAKVANDARRAGTIVKTIKAGATGGMKAAKAAAKTAKAAQHVEKAGRIAGLFSKVAPTVTKFTTIGGKQVPVVKLLTAAYAVGTTGWFATRGRKFNKACYSLLKVRLDDGSLVTAIVEPGRAGEPVEMMLGSPLRAV